MNTFESKTASATGLPLGGRRILVAEDGPDNQRLIEYHLNRAGAEVDFADNGKLAVELACDETASFDAIVLDRHMPVMDGYTAASVLRDNGFTLPIIALTAQALQNDPVEAIEAGCDAYQSKPVDAPRLTALLVGLIDAHERSAIQPATA